MTYPEHHFRGLDRGQPQRQCIVDRLVRRVSGHAPQRVFGQHVDTAALHLGIGQLELHALEGRQCLAELLTEADVCDRQVDGPVQHAQ